MPFSMLVPIFLLLTGCSTGVRGNWFDSEDMQLFDLVEEVNGTFYEFMNLNQVWNQKDNLSVSNFDRDLSVPRTSLQRWRT